MARRQARYVVELFGNTAAGGAESELFLEETRGPYGRGRRRRRSRCRIDAVARPIGVRSVTATVTSEDGATSALSAPAPSRIGR